MALALGPVGALAAGAFADATSETIALATI